MLLGVQRGVLGGTFDPPHLAHLVAAEAAYHQLDLDVVSFVPAGAPWQKAGAGVTAPAHRLAMTALAIAGTEYFVVDDREVQRGGWTYTIDTIETYPADDAVTLIVGADAAAGVPGWHRAAELMECARFAVVPRPGASRRAVEDALAEARFEWLDMPEMAISSTALRSRTSAGLSLRFLVPRAVEDYIEERGLYREE